MSGSATDDLHNPFWACLATRHAHIALGGPLARRYPSHISPIAGLPARAAANVAALQRLFEAGDDAALVGPYVPSLAGDWQTLNASELIQMLRSDPAPLPEGDLDTLVLSASDVDDLYRRLGFVVRTKLPLLHAKRIS